MNEQKQKPPEIDEAALEEAMRELRAYLASGDQSPVLEAPELPPVPTSGEQTMVHPHAAEGRRG
jgi:hypothetical protein